MVIFEIVMECLRERKTLKLNNFISTSSNLLGLQKFYWHIQLIKYTFIANRQSLECFK